MKENIALKLNEMFVGEIKSIIDNGRQKAYKSVNAVMLDTYWRIGRRIVEEEQHGQQRAGYGEQLIQSLSERLTLAYGKGFSPRYLSYFREFYLTIPDIQILQTRLQNLTWSHVLKTLRVDNPTAMRWYLETSR